MGFSRLAKYEKNIRDRLPADALTIVPRVLITLFLAIAIFFVHQSFLEPGMFLVHDGEIHVIRAIHFWKELRNGQLPVRMVSQSAFQFGYPLFQFFYPLPYYFTAIFQFLGLSAGGSWKIMQIIVSIASVWAMYRWLRCHFDRLPSFVGASLYLFVPYRLLTMYVTGQIGGLFSLLWAPIIGWGLYSVLIRRRNWGGAMYAIGIAGLITSHFISVVILGLALSGYGLWIFAKYLTWQNLRRVLFWTSVGVGLSAFYLLPFLLERSWVRLGHGILVDHRDHWPTFQQILYSPWGYGHSNAGTNDGMSFQVGLALWATSALSFLALGYRYVGRKSFDLLALIQLFVFACLIFLLVPQSAPVWELVTPLQYLQYPWRLLAATSVVGVWLAAWLVARFRGWRGLLTATFLVTLAVYNSRNYLRAWPHDRRPDSFYMEEPSRYYGSTDISWELLPISVEDAPNALPQRAIQPPEIELLSVERPESGDIRYRAEVYSAVATEAAIPIWDLPVWRARVNGTAAPITTAPNGEIQVSLPEGQSIVTVELRQTRLQKIGDIITLASALVLLFRVNYHYISGFHARRKQLLRSNDSLVEPERVLNH